MHGYLRLGLLALIPALAAHGQASCSSAALANAGKSVAQIRHTLHGAAVTQADAAVPASIAAELAQLKNALTSAAQAAFSCAPAGATPDQLQRTLADALHANLASATETVETRNKKDFGAYGSDLSVQVFQLFGRPKLFEVDFRYGIECGDDNLLLVFETSSDTDPAGWHERLRWDAPSYNTVGDALGDFVMLTPLTGSYQSPTWRFLVAHGHPGCAAGAHPSVFDLDLLSPTADPAKPHVDWHFAHAYTQSTSAAPRLSTTEDTVDFRIVHQADADKTAKPAPAPEIYRFHLTSNGQLEPSLDGASDGSARP